MPALHSFPQKMLLLAVWAVLSPGKQRVPAGSRRVCDLREKWELDGSFGCFLVTPQLSSSLNAELCCTVNHESILTAS